MIASHSAPLLHTYSLGPLTYRVFCRAQVRYFKCRSAVCALIMEATRSCFVQARPRRIEIKTSQLFRMAASAPHLLVTESAADGCLARQTPPERNRPSALGKKGESSAPSVFHAFLGAICERPLLCCCVPLCSLTHRTLRREENSALSLSVSPSVTQVRRFFPLTFRVSSASTLVCSTYLLTSRVLVNVGLFRRGAW